MRPNFFSAALGVAILAGASMPAFADGNVTHQTGAASTTDFRALSAQAAHAAAVAKSLGGNSAKPVTRAGEAIANPYRAYPASCLEAPLPLQLYQNDPFALQTTLRLSGDPVGGASEEVNYTEVDTVTVFRVVCSSGKSATLLEIDRPANAAAYPYPVFPGVFVTLSDNSKFPLRVVDDPNTFLPTTAAYAPLFYSDVFVLENYFDATQPQFDYNQAFTLNVDNLIAGSAHDVASFNLGTYLPSSYPEASQALKVNGYMSGNWFDPAHSGEGIQIEVGEQATYPARYMVVAWYTYDEMGFPYWLLGSGGFNAGDRAADITLSYSGDGGFAGNFGAKATSATWGTIHVTFPSCGTMKFTYAANAGLPGTVPQGTGTKTWSRATDLNGLTCE